MYPPQQTRRCELDTTAATVDQGRFPLKPHCHLFCAVDSPESGRRKPCEAADSGGSPRATSDQRSLGACADPSPTAQLRSDLKPARTSSEKSFGCSHAAK